MRICLPYTFIFKTRASSTTRLLLVEELSCMEETMNFVYDNCLFRNNSADRNGGAVDMQSSGYAVFRSCNFTTCSASVGSALNIFGTNDNVILEDSLFTKNVADHGT